MLSIEATKSSPKILFSEADLSLEISGESYPENSFEFFGPLFLWCAQTLPHLPSLVLKVNIRYMNSSSTKCMLDLLDLLSEASQKGCQASVRWYWEQGNDRAFDLAEEFKEDLDLPFEIVALKPGEAL